VADRGDDQQAWYLGAKACGAVCLAMFTAAASLAGATSHLAVAGPFMVTVYAAASASAACFVAGVRAVRFSLAAGERLGGRRESFFDHGTALRPGERLQAGQMLWARDVDGAVRFVMRGDGTMEVSCSGNALAPWRTLWERHARRARYLDFRTDGNLVLCADDGTLLIDWRATGMGGKELRVQGDGNVVLYADEDRVVWATDELKDGRTVRRAAPGTRAQPRRRLAGPGFRVRWVEI
jgi:hypothetical protein